MKLVDAIRSNPENMFMHSKRRKKVAGFDINGLPINAIDGTAITLDTVDWFADDWRILSNDEFLAMVNEEASNEVN